MFSSFDNFYPRKKILMTNIVLLGGNGYIGRATTEEWMRVDPTA
ncbi:hypothetical protein [Alloscardovia macacae]|nr:hypothetical protein [Alloscardovia macacae]